MKQEALSIGNIGGLFAGVVCWANIADTVYLIIGILSLLVSLICGIIQIVGKIKESVKDGKITEEEIGEIMEQIAQIDSDIKKELKKIEEEQNELNAREDNKGN